MMRCHFLLLRRGVVAVSRAPSTRRLKYSHRIHAVDATQMKNTLDDDEKGVADKLSADDKEEIENTINEALDWLDENPEADKDEYTSKQKEVEAIANPIMRNVYQGAGGPGGGEEEEDYDFGDDEL